ncbi:MAG TPA: hypothetical protein VF805_10915 [Anaeromyxobacteraceae bacterium]
MGIKKMSKRLAKLGRKASQSLGKGGKAWVEEVFEAAMGVIEDELRKKGAKARAAKPGAAKPGAGSPARAARRPAANTRRKKLAAPRKTAKRTAKPVARARPAAVARRGSKAPLAASTVEGLAPVTQAEHLADQPVN